MLVYQRVMSLEYFKMDTKNDGLGKAVSLYLRQMSVVTRMGVTDPWAATDARTELGTLGLENGRHPLGLVVWPCSSCIVIYYRNSLNFEEKWDSESLWSELAFFLILGSPPILGWKNTRASYDARIHPSNTFASVIHKKWSDALVSCFIKPWL